MLSLDNICPHTQVVEGFLQIFPQDTTKFIGSINSNFGEYPQDFLCFFVTYYFGEYPQNTKSYFQVNINLYLYPQCYNHSKATHGELRCLKKPFTRFKTFPNVQNGYHNFAENSAKNSFYGARLIERNRASIEGSF